MKFLSAALTIVCLSLAPNPSYALSYEASYAECQAPSCDRAASWQSADPYAQGCDGGYGRQNCQEAPLGGALNRLGGFCQGNCQSGTNCSLYGYGGGQNCGPLQCAPRNWFATVNGLIMTRERGDDLFLGYSDSDPSARLLTLNDASQPFSGGFETRIGRYLNQQWAVEGVYWGFYPSDQTAHLYAADVAGNVVSPLQFDMLEYDNGTGAAPAGDYFDNTQTLRVVRSYEHHNVEVNFWRSAFVPTCRSGPVRLGLLAGVRYMQLGEVFDFDTDVNNTTFGDDLANELFYEIDVENHLIGFQIGGNWNRCLTQRLSLQIGSKLGIFGNHMRHRQTLWGGNGSALISGASPLGYAGSAYSSNSSKDDVAFLGELIAGLSYQITPCWRANLGYRAVTIAGVALPEGQIPLRFDDLAAVDSINSSDSVVLHGAYAGLSTNW